MTTSHSYRSVPDRQLRCLIGSKMGLIQTYPADVAEVLLADGRAQDPEKPWSPRTRNPGSGMPATPGLTHSTAALASELRAIRDLLTELVEQGGKRK